MQIGNYTIILGNIFVIRSIIFVISIYGAYENIFRKRLSLFGPDRLFYLIALLFDRNAKNSVKSDPKVLKKLGFYSVLLAIGSVINCFTISK